MNADLELFGGSALQQQRKIGAIPTPKPVCYSPCLKRHVALVQKGGQQCLGCWIMQDNRL